MPPRRRLGLALLLLGLHTGAVGAQAPDQQWLDQKMGSWYRAASRAAPGHWGIAVADQSGNGRIVGNPPGTAPVHPLGAVAVRVDLDPYLGMAALAAYVGLSRRTVQNLVTDPTDPLPTYRVGGKLLARRSEVDAWMTRRRNGKPLAAARLAATDARALLAARPKKIAAIP